eukprot:SAG31_NODE_90_length_26410_cov_175.663981_8_plen_243_part_00
MRCPGQLCWLAPGLKEYLAKRVPEILRAQPNATIISISQNDDTTYCKTGADLMATEVRGYFLVFVPATREIRDFYREMQRTNRESITMYRRRALQLPRCCAQSTTSRTRFAMSSLQWRSIRLRINTQGVYRYCVSILCIDIVHRYCVSILCIDTLAYQCTRPAPNKTKPRPNVIVRLCSIECNFLKPLTDPSNAAFTTDIISWNRISDRLYICKSLSSSTRACVGPFRALTFSICLSVYPFD